MTTTNTTAGQPAYTAAQYEERIKNLADALYDLIEISHRLNTWQHAGVNLSGGDWGDLYAITNDARAALSTERAHRTAEQAPESEVERARRLA